MGELSKLPNIGKTVEEQLSQVGFSSAGELMKVGVKADLKEFYQQHKKQDFS